MTGSTRNESQRGSTLIVTLLVIILVSSLGLFAVRASGSELVTAGSHRFASTARHAAGALNAGIGWVNDRYDALMTNALLNNTGMILVEGATIDPDLFAPDSLGRLAATPSVLIRAWDPIDLNTVAGYSTNSAQFCFKSLTFEGTGSLEPNVAVSGAGTTIRLRAHAQVGPFGCNM